MPYHIQSHTYIDIRPTHTQYFFYRSDDHRDLHSFPTRRSSDLYSITNRSAAAVHMTAAVTKSASGITVSATDRKSTRLNSSHVSISYAVFCLKKKNKVSTKTASNRHEYSHELSNTNPSKYTNIN